MFENIIEKLYYNIMILSAITDEIEKRQPPNPSAKPYAQTWAHTTYMVAVCKVSLWGYVARVGVFKAS